MQSYTKTMKGRKWEVKGMLARVNEEVSLESGDMMGRCVLGMQDECSNE